MKTKLFNLFIIIISLFTLYNLLMERSIISTSIILALDMWVHSLIPSLFPFFIISDILINYNITSYIPKIIMKLCKQVFNITDNMFTVFLLSMISGFPSNARNTRILYDKGLIDEYEANHILMFSHFANPIFIITTVGAFFLHSNSLGLILLITHYLSNIILGICIRNRFKHDGKIGISDFQCYSFGNIFISSIKKAIDTILMICGIVVVFLILATIITNAFNFNLYNQMIIKGILEITIGIQALGNLEVGIDYKLVIASMFLAFGGFSVHIQVYSQIVDTKIKYYYFLIGRIWQMVISGILAYLYYFIIGI